MTFGISSPNVTFKALHASEEQYRTLQSQHDKFEAEFECAKSVYESTKLKWRASWEGMSSN